MNQQREPKLFRITNQKSLNLLDSVQKGDGILTDGGSFVYILGMNEGRLSLCTESECSHYISTTTLHDLKENIENKRLKRILKLSYDAKIGKNATYYTGSEVENYKTAKERFKLE